MKREPTNEELLDRYIHAVKLMLVLPPDKMEDIGAEVRSNLESELEDQARVLGRELRPDEVSALLKRHGHPMKVALRYREAPQRGLISPALFPLYWFTLRAVFALWVTIRVIVSVFAFQGASPAGTILLNFGRDVLLAGLIIPAGVTLLFAIWEYLEYKFRYSERWKPESLAPIPRIGHPRSQQRPMVHISGGVVWLVFWAMALFMPALSWVWGGRGVFSPSDAVYAMRLPLWLLAAFGISQSWLTHTRFAAAEWRRFLRLAVVVAGLVLGLFLLLGGDLLVPGPNWNPTQAKSLATLNQMTAGILVLVCVGLGLSCLRELYGSLRRTGGPRHTADSTS